MSLSIRAIQNQTLLAADLKHVRIGEFPRLIESLQQGEWPAGIGGRPDCWEGMQIEQRIMAGARLQAALLNSCGPKMVYRYKMREQLSDQEFEDWWSYHGEVKTLQEELLMKNYGYGARY